MEKFKNKYRIASTRLQQWNYGDAALYFITLCTQNRIHYFGEIVDMVETPCMASLPYPQRKMQLSEMGKIVEIEWLKTFELRPDMNLFQGEFMVMPDHFHAIIGIGENEYNTPCCRNAMHCVSTITDKPQNHFGPQSKNLASIVRGFKSSVTIAARKWNPEFKWQPRFYDHIIRDDASFQKITNYIINNPANWQEDKLFKAE